MKALGFNETFFYHEKANYVKRAKVKLRLSALNVFVISSVFGYPVPCVAGLSGFGSPMPLNLVCLAHSFMLITDSENRSRI
jgi:hypothetical protein